MPPPLSIVTLSITNELQLNFTAQQMKVHKDLRFGLKVAVF